MGKSSRRSRDQRKPSRRGRDQGKSPRRARDQGKPSRRSRDKEDQGEIRITEEIQGSGGTAKETMQGLEPALAVGAQLGASHALLYPPRPRVQPEKGKCSPR